MGEEKPQQEWRQYTHSQAVARLKDVFDELERLQQKGERAPLDDRDAERFAELSTEFDQVRDHKDALERKAATEVRRAERERLRSSALDAVNRGSVERGSYEVGEFDRDAILEPDSIESKRFRNPWDLSEMRTLGRDRGEVSSEMRARALSAIEKMQGTSDKVRAAATSIIEAFDDSESTLSRMCLATSSPEYMRAWVKVMRGRQNGLTQEEQAALTRAMSLTDASGGVLVPFQMDPTVIITSAGSRNDIRQIARQVVATGDVWNGVSSGAASWSWDAEGAQVSDDTTTFVQPSITNHKGAGFIPISIEALQDEANVTTEVARILAFGKDTLEAAAFVTGTGVGQPTGIITALVASSPSVIQTSTTTDTFAVADIFKVDGALPARHRRNASWLANRKTYNLVRQFDTNGGAALWERLGADVPPQLLGRGAFESEDMDGVISAGSENYMLAYGDMQSYVITDRIGFQVEQIPHLFGANNRPTGSRGWYAYYRTGADSVDDSSMVLLNVT
jgi:HK97 family phage major capsid protein